MFMTQTQSFWLKGKGKHQSSHHHCGGDSWSLQELEVVGHFGRQPKIRAVEGGMIGMPESQIKCFLAKADEKDIVGICC